jgi:hypothetical protein
MGGSPNGRRFGAGAEGASEALGEVD